MRGPGPSSASKRSKPPLEQRENERATSAERMRPVVVFHITPCDTSRIMSFKARGRATPSRFLKAFLSVEAPPFSPRPDLRRVGLSKPSLKNPLSKSTPREERGQLAVTPLHQLQGRAAARTCGLFAPLRGPRSEGHSLRFSHVLISENQGPAPQNLCARCIASSMCNAVVPGVTALHCIVSPSPLAPVLPFSVYQPTGRYASRSAATVFPPSSGDPLPPDKTGWKTGLRSP